MSKNLAIVEHVDGTALQPYRDRDEVRELAERLLSLHPASSDVGQAGMFAVAQLALMIGASPLPGVNEIHVWTNVNRQTGEKTVQFQLGVNYYRRKAEEAGGLLFKIQPRQMRENERKEYGVSQGQLAAICQGVRVRDMEKYIALGFKPNDIWEMAGAVGIGVAGVNEAKHGRPPIWTAFKRAEVDLYRRLFPTMLHQVAQAQVQTDVRVIDDPGSDWDEIGEFEEIGEEDEDERMTANQLNDWFGLPTEEDEEPAAKAPNTPQNGEKQGDAPQHTNGHDMTPPDPDVVALWRDKCAKLTRVSAGTVASMVANAVPFFDDMWHALGYTDYESSDPIDNGEKLNLFDELVEAARRKVQETEEEE